MECVQCEANQQVITQIECKISFDIIFIDAHKKSMNWISKVETKNSIDKKDCFNADIWFIFFEHKEKYESFASMHR